MTNVLQKDGHRIRLNSEKISDLFEYDNAEY